MATATDSTFLVQAATYLGATAIAVPVFKRLKLGTILGFLAAGVALGPSGLALLQAEEGMFHVAEFGVVLFLFVVGLELSFARLWSLRRTIFGLGLLQMLLTGSVLGGAFLMMGLLTPGPAMLAGFALACSSTAFALSLLEERGELNTPYGTKAFSVLLFQDLAVIPLLAAVPFVALAQQGAAEGMEMDWEAILFAAGAIALLILMGRFLLNPFFRLVAVSGSREAFTAAALFVVAGVALLVSEAGLSMALGGFLAGVLLAESKFRHQIESDIEPFRELLLGLFFIGVGMQLDLGVVWSYWWIVLGATAGLILFKMTVLFLLARLFGARDREPWRIAAVLCQGGEFGFVVFSLGAGRGVFDPELATLLSAIVTLSMMVTPLIVSALAGGRRSSAERPHPPRDERRDVLLVGFGRVGQIIAQVLIGSGVKVTAIDSDPDRIATARSFGHEVYYGDGTDLHLLMHAGALSADAIVFAIRDTPGMKRTIRAVRERCPKVRIVARAYDRMAALELMDSEADLVIRDTLESALLTAGETLRFLGRSDGTVTDVLAEFRERDQDRLLAQKAEGIYAQKERIGSPFAAARRDRKPEDVAE
ncbi:monovalent cation:proton antiporter-2 (CPA2) family protein [Parvularcula oceani]|uniref:monovalent cation:proton antiporter-2 (CPA2) family protein n=1 Tax=Parvularcula oceani TaxID=1247963 RepID=UPI00068AA921|nr:monovalent cation:proton antiporter-2 (CPA2) family protein [Parvularcula oceani]